MKIKLLPEKKIFQNEFFIYFFLALFAWILYSKTLLFGFTWFDDDWLVFRQIDYYADKANILKVFTYNIIPWEYCYYRPVLILSFFLDFILSGNSTAPFFYHLTNILFHIGCTLSLFYLLRNYFMSKKAAAAWSLIFACHPVLTQAVAWVPGRNDVLLCLFTLLSFIFFIKFVKRENALYFILTIIFWTIALFTKENALFLPLIFAAYIYLINRNNAFQSKNSIYKYAFMALLFIILSVIYSKLRIINTGDILPSIPYISIIKEMPKILCTYIGKIILPFNLSVVAYIPDTKLIYGVISSAIIVLICFIVKIKDLKVFAFGIIWFVIFLTPALIPLNTVMLEHRIYLPLIGLLISFNQLYFPLLASKISSKIKITFFILYIIFLSFLTLKHSDSFKSPVIFWEAAAAQSPSYQAVYSNLGKVYLEREYDLENAEKILQKAYDLNPDDINNQNLLTIQKIKSYGGIDEYIRQRQPQK